MDTVSFRRMDEGTAEDYELLARHEDDMLRELPDRMLEAVAALDRSYGGYKVTRKEHSLQSATRAYRDERDEEYAVAALLHDVGDVLAPHTHARERYPRPPVVRRLCRVLRALRPELLRPGLRAAAARVLRTDGAQGVRGAALPRARLRVTL